MNWWQRLTGRARLEEQLENELRFHLEQHVADLIGRGVDPAEARRQARLALGGSEQVKEQCRDVRGTRWLEDFWQDVRYALRTLRQKPGFTAVALSTLALGIGATTVMFTVINAVLLKPLAYPEPERLLTLQEQTVQANQFGNLWAFTYPNFVDCRRESRLLSMAAWTYGGGTVSAPGEPEHVDGFAVSADLFSVLGIPLLKGRSFLPEEDRPGAAPVAIISHKLWQRHFGGGAFAPGPLILDGKPYTVIGVAPPGFQLNLEGDVFTLLGQRTDPFLQNREAHFLQAVARLRSGATMARARAELALIGHRLEAQYPASNAGRSFIAEPLQRNVVRDVQSTLWLLLGAVSLVLWIGCANVASLLLARAVSRSRELAMRAALGAGRFRLVRQCLTESTVLALAGGLLGFLLTTAGIRPFVKFWPGSLPRASEVAVDWHVLLFALLASLFCGILFGLAPALRVPTAALEQALRSGAHSVGGAWRRLHSGFFVIAEIGLAVVLLVAAVTLASTMLRLTSLDPGVTVSNLLIGRVAISPTRLASPPRTRAAWSDLLDRTRGVPGVQSVAMVDTVPMREGVNFVHFWSTPAAPPLDRTPFALATSVTPDYARTMGLPVLHGRFFNDQDRMGAQQVVVIDEVLARHAFGTEDAVGRRLYIEAMDPQMIVGVVRHVRHWGLAGDDQAEVRDQIYYPFAQLPDPLVRRWSELMSIAVRTNVPPLSVVKPLEHAVAGASGDQIIYELRTMEQLAGASLARQRFLLLLFGVFAGLALVLASIGIYGVLAYLTSQRVPEIGVRMALGASARDVLRMVLGQSLGMVGIGVVLGATAALAAVRLLEKLVVGVRANELATLATAILVIMLAASFASFLPARRASRIDPMSALRQD